MHSCPFHRAVSRIEWAEMGSTWHLTHRRSAINVCNYNCYCFCSYSSPDPHCPVAVSSTTAGTHRGPVWTQRSSHLRPVGQLGAHLQFQVAGLSHSQSFLNHFRQWLNFLAHHIFWVFGLSFRSLDSCSYDLFFDHLFYRYLLRIQCMPDVVWVTRIHIKHGYWWMRGYECLFHRSPGSLLTNHQVIVNEAAKVESSLNFPESVQLKHIQWA